ncbi:DNRLRE domain-containing protein [Bacillus sp. AFS029533]|uniref:DNRLRE domain-containing protein n=1 Tax=Bacillus sp. AFS029533 TaxID=2033494 RepID=UPI000BFDD7AE|nr:DNRLRE domain-containing protein [Bacillus sp. AFS029533]PGZ92182.1 Wall-associated protein [Bacillus sp. AFS029533]
MARVKKNLASLLVFLLIFCSVPQNGWAEEKSQQKAQDQSANQEVGAPKAIYDLPIGEVVKERDAFSKVFYNGDGTFTKKIYSQPINKKVKGKDEWEEISSSLIDSSDETKVKTENAILTASFNKHMKNGEYANFDFNGHEVGYSLIEASGESKTVSTVDGPANFKIKGHEVIYKKVFPDIDFRNITFDQNNKEDLVLRSYKGYNTFKFHITTDLEAKIQKDKSIDFYVNGTDEKVFNLPKPFMADSNYDDHSGEVATSEDVKYDLKKVTDGYNLTIVADQNWLKDPSRVYPVYIDPSTSINTMTDTFVMSAYPSVNYSTSTDKWDSAQGQYVLKTGYYDGTTGTCYGYLNQSLSSLDNMIITNADFHAYVTHSYYATTANGLWLDSVNSSWSAGTMTWNNKPASTNISSVNVMRDQWANFDVTSTVKAWVDGTKPNYGFKLHTNGNGQTYWKKVVSTTNSTLKPYLSVDYTIPTPQAPTGKVFSNGNGTGYVNLSWQPVVGATGYKVWIFNGTAYESFNVGNVSSWSTNGQKVWPTSSEINSGKYDLHQDKLGAELPLDPSSVYKNSGGTYSSYKNYWFRVSAVFLQGESSISSEFMPTIPNLAQPDVPTGTSFNNGNGTGYIDFNWKPIPGATGYKIWIFNGSYYESKDVGNVTSWSTKGKKYWPTSTEITAGKYQLHLSDSLGAELASNPATVYAKAGTTYANTTNYYIRVSAYNSIGETIYSNPLMPTIPDVPVPPAPRGLANSNKLGSNSGYVTLNWDKVANATGYKVWVFNGSYYESIDVGDVSTWTTQNKGIWPTQSEITSGTLSNQEMLHLHNDGKGMELDIDPSKMYAKMGTGYANSKTYYFRLSAYNAKGESIFSNSYYSTVIPDASGTASIDSPSKNETVSGTVNIAGNSDMEKMNVSVTKYGTNNSIILGEKIGKNSTWSWDSTKVSDGEYSINLTGSDSMGHNASTSINVKVQNLSQGLGLDYGATTENQIGTVNMANGNLIVSNTDIKLPGRGLGTEFTRVYNSQMKTNGVLGWGWQLGVPDLSLYSDGSVLITDAYGAKHIYTENGYGSYNRPKGEYDTLIKNTDGTFTLESKNGIKYIFNLTNNKISKLDKNDNIVVYQFDTNNRLISIADPTNRVTNFGYDTNTGKLTTVKDYIGRNWYYTYDANGNLIKVTDPLNHSESYTYDPSHQLLSITNARENTTNFTYTSNKLTAVMDPLNYKTAYSYDGTNSEFTETDAKGNITKYAYDANWNIKFVTDALNNVTSYTYDTNNNNLTKTDALGRVTKFSYDSMGNQISVTDPMNHTNTYIFDVNSNILSKTDSLGNVTNFSYDLNGNLLTDGTKSYTYNSDGTVSTENDANGNSTEYNYDSNGNLLTVTDSINNETQMTYDKAGNKVSEIDASGNKTNFTYDALGKMLSVTVDRTMDPRTTSYTYDEVGNKLTTTDANGNVSSWTYDELNRVIAETSPDKKVQKTTYDTSINVLSKTAADGTVTYFTYDQLNRLTQVKNPDGKMVSYHYDAIGNKVNLDDSTGTTIYEYDQDNNLIKQTDPSGTVTTFNYNAENQLIGKVVDGKSFTYKYTQGNITSIKDSNNLTTEFNYDANKNRTAINYANGAKINYNYNEGNELTDVSNLDSNGVAIANFHYTYDNSKIITATDNKGITSYEYDGQNRLTKITDPVGKITEYTYDGVGNRISESNTENGVTSTTVYTYDNDNNELKKIIYPDGSTISYSYDANGNILTKTDKSGTASYEYNSNNQLTKVIKPNGDVLEYAYDGDNKRISKTVNGVVTKYVYDGEQISKEIDESDNVLAYYVYDDKGSPISVTMNGKVYNYQYNGHGDVIALTDSKDHVVSTYEYDVWGNLIDKTAEIDSMYGYAGQFGYVYDKETGYYFLKSRYYDPEIGRFTTKDRFKGFEDRPASQNQYTYCENDPINNVDPSGYFTIKFKINTKTVANIIDIALTLIGIGAGAMSFAKAMKLLLNQRVYVREAIIKYVKRVGMSFLTTSVSGVFNILGKIERFSDLASVGGLLAAGMDWLDGKYDGKINVNITVKGWW